MFDFAASFATDSCSVLLASESDFLSEFLLFFSESAFFMSAAFSSETVFFISDVFLLSSSEAELSVPEVFSSLGAELPLSSVSDVFSTSVEASSSFLSDF